MSSTAKIALVCIGIITLIVSCNTMHNQQEEKTMPAKPIEEVLAKYTDELMSISGVVGTAQGLFKDKPCITVLVIKKTSELSKKIPKTLEGYPVVVKETGEIRALPD
jgi:hypothetical protein